MKNITAIERIAMQKTAIQKKQQNRTFSDCILFSCILFSWGGNNLQVQEQKSLKKTGWFVGVNPFSPSIELETKQSLSATDFSRTTETISGFDFPQVIRILKA